jgi:hypothetical protein
LPPSSQVLTSTSNNNNQTITIGASITPIVFTWSGDATDADVTGLPAGVDAVKDAIAKTITLSGTPTATGSATYTVITSGSAGTPVAASGTITVNAVVSGNQIHNFTVSGKTSSFYTITGNMNSTAGSTTLTARLKIETATTITYTTAAVSTLTLVFDPTFTGKIKVNNVSTASAVGGVITVSSVPAGAVSITKGDTANLFYIKTAYASLGLGDNVEASKLTLYPNPVSDQLYISSDNQKIENVMIYSLSGGVVKNIPGEVESIDVSNLTTGNYLVRVTTDQGSFAKKIIKK